MKPGDKTQSEIVSTEFETDDDLTTVSSGVLTTELPTKVREQPEAPTQDGSKKDYVDYDSDVTIPPHLNDLLANLPQDINADSLQKMFRDSVADRRALLQGFDMLINKV